MLGLTTIAGASNAQIGPPTGKRRNYVLVHGAAHGGWCWNKIVEPLRSAGHQVFTPTMTGLGERKHLLTKDVDIYTHCQDLINVLEYEELTDVILVCHSYGGLVTTLVADRIIRHVGDLACATRLYKTAPSELSDAILCCAIIVPLIPQRPRCRVVVNERRGVVTLTNDKRRKASSSSVPQSSNAPSDPKSSPAANRVDWTA